MISISSSIRQAKLLKQVTLGQKKRRKKKNSFSFRHCEDAHEDYNEWSRSDDGSTWVVGRTTFLIITVFLFCVHSSLSIRTALWVKTSEITKQVAVGSSKGWKCNHCDVE